MTTEHRTSPRRYVRQCGVICNSDGAIVSKCMMADVSATGAKLILQGPTEVPDEFILVLSSTGKVRRHCKVVRRSETVIGVIFVFTSPVTAQGTSLHKVNV